MQTFTIDKSNLVLQKVIEREMEAHEQMETDKFIVHSKYE